MIKREMIQREAIKGEVGMERETLHATKALSVENARFDKVLRELQNEIANIAPFAEATKKGVPQRGKGAGRLISIAKASETRRVAQLDKKSARFRLMDLPYEIRIIILQYAIDPIKYPPFLCTTSKNGQRNSRKISTPPLARVRNGQLRMEALVVAIEKSSFKIYPENREDVVQWLSNLTFEATDTSYKTGLDVVKALHFPYFGNYEDVQLAMGLKNLQSLSLGLGAADLSRLAASSGGDHDNPAFLDEILREYSFECLLGLRSLKRLELAVSMNDGASEADSFNGLMAPIGILSAWLESEFEKRGGKAELWYLC